MKRQFTWLLLFVFLMGTNAMAQKIVLNENQTLDSEIRVLSEQNGETQLKLSFNAFELVDIETPNGIQSKVISEGASALNKKGFPDIPKIAQSIIISETNGVDVIINDAKYIDYQNIDLAPAKGILSRANENSKVPFEYAEVYQKDAFFPENLVQVNNPYILRDKRGVAIWMYPIQYNPVTKVLRVYSEIDFSVVKNSLKGTNELVNSVIQKSSIYENVYSNHFANYDASKYDVVSDEGSMLIIAYDDYAAEMTDFVAWKRSRGMDVTLVKFSEVGTSDDDIVEYVNNIYNTDGLTFLLLVGDAPQVPATVKKGNDSDAAYGHIIGNDSYAEVIVGRFSGESVADIATQVKRTIHYERDLTSEDTWLSTAVGIASDEGGPSTGDDAEADIEHMDNIRTDLIEYGYAQVDQLYDPGASASTLSASLNEGRGLINYIGHGSDYSFVTTGFSNSNVNALTNTGKLPYIFSVACVNGNFVNQTCFAEAWLRATHDDLPAGAVAMYASTINQSWASPMDGQDEMNDLLTHRIDSNVKVTFGGIAINGSMHMNDEYGADGSTMTDTWTIFGDPSLIVRNTTPQVIVPEYAAALPIGSTTLDISLDANGTKVCMIKDSVLVASGIISEGMVSLDISSVVIPGEADIVIVGQQVETFIGEFMFIVPSGPYLVSQNYTISNDDNADSIAGYGETFNLNLSLKNVGVEVAEQVAISITTSNEYVESISLNSNVVLGDVNVEETKKSTNSFLIKLKNNVPDQHHITFNAVAKANNYEGEWAYNIALVANAPTLGLQSVTYNDDFEGNVVNNLIEAGETGEILCTIANVGHANIDQLNAVLINVNNDAAIVSNISSLSDITISDEGIAQLVFNITANADIYPGTIFPMQIDINAGEYEFKNEFDLQVGVMPDVIIGEVDEISSCFGFFYDSGKDEAYENNENKVTTIMPLIDGNKIEMTFEEFSIESGYDYLHVYDGNNTDENEIEGSPFSGTDIPEVILATNETGALTFKFTSDSYANDNGWKATFECISMDMPCVNVVQPQNNETLDYNFTTISWQPIEDAVVYHVYYGESIATKPSASISDTSFIVENLNENTAYKFKVIPESASGDQPQECAIYTFTSGSTALLMHTGVVAVGNGYFFDNGGLDDYTLNAGDTLTMIPVIDGKAVAVNFEEFALEQGVDKLYIYNGMEVSESTLIGMYDQSNPSLIGNDGSVVASIEGGALTFVFESDSKISASGWKASIELVELVGISESFTHSVSIHPNPVVSVLTVSADAEFEISVLDVSGKILYQNIGQERYELNMDAYKSGLYFVQIIDQNGQIYIRKVVRSED